MGVTAEQIQITENEFFTSTPEALAFKTDENLDRLYAYIVGAWGETSTTNVACWEIAFKALRGKLNTSPATCRLSRMKSEPGYGIRPPIKFAISTKMIKHSALFSMRSQKRKRRYVLTHGSSSMQKLTPTWTRIEPRNSTWITSNSKPQLRI